MQCIQVTSCAPSSYSCIITTGIGFQINFEKLLHLTKYGRSIPHLCGHIPPPVTEISIPAPDKRSQCTAGCVYSFSPVESTRKYLQINPQNEEEQYRVYQETPSLFRLVFLAVSRIVSVNNHQGYKTVSSCSVSSCKSRVESPHCCCCSR